MTICRSDCGQCCNPVMLPYSQLEAQLAGDEIDADTLRWVLHDLTRIPYREGLALAPHLRGRSLCNAQGEATSPIFYRCRHFDVETRSCTNYDNRPDVCRGFPWYDQEPHPAKTLPPDCSYWEDIPLIQRPYR